MVTCSTKRSTAVSRFKGLENEAVILVDLPDPLAEGHPGPDHYVGMSRAQALLSIIFAGPRQCQ